MKKFQGVSNPILISMETDNFLNTQESHKSYLSKVLFNYVTTDPINNKIRICKEFNYGGFISFQLSNNPKNISLLMTFEEYLNTLYDDINFELENKI